MVRLSPSFRVLLGLVLASVIGVGCKKKTVVTTDSQSVILGKESYVVARMQVLETGPILSGTLKPKKSATVRAQVSGSVLEMYVVEGQSVGQGAILARLDSRAIAESQLSASSAISAARSTVDLARREAQRLETLHQAGAIAERDVENARRQVAAAESQLAQAQSQLAQIQKQAENTLVRAPFGGVVSEKLASMGDVVQPGAALITIVQPSSMELEANIAANELGAIRVGLPVKFVVNGYPEQPFTGRITRINPTADPVTRQVRVYAEIPNAGNSLVGGLYAEGRVSSILRTTIALPEDAIDRKLLTPSIEMIESGRVVRKDVTLGIHDDKNGVTQIISGINAGDTVLRGAAQEIALGTRVQILDRTASGMPANAVRDSVAIHESRNADSMRRQTTKSR